MFRLIGRVGRQLRLSSVDKMLNQAAQTDLTGSIPVLVYNSLNLVGLGAFDLTGWTNVQFLLYLYT